ncbi:MAG: hypothetical protein OZSIB_1826 [Candidatus Ozemobacter sibiricus]|uniref:Putative Flp pilus-assembly TadG-like N-terminal domain-containing protein n=1 Tax=Candidatus Ozemobacter sibiricus TaxID=2268124 RepID=A0A367ZJ39_9BACT|nr:MAG: hypothetical protein OZSIB_1826 [Candidatus Ozemobacter sibiricus]
MKTISRVSRPDRGSILFLSTLGLMLLFAIMALAIDVGYMYYQKARIETAVNAGWKAGIDYTALILPSSSVNGVLTTAGRDQVRNHVKQVIDLNYPGITVLTTFPTPNTNRLRVQGTYPFGLFFSRLIWRNATTVAAERGGPGGDAGGDGVIPIGIPHGRMVQYNQQYYDVTMFGPGQGFNPGEEYILRLGRTGSDNPPKYKPPSGADQWHVAGSLDFGSGASDYEWFFKYGYPGQISVNNRVWTGLGEAHGPTDVARDFRAADPNRRMVIIPILDAAPDVNPINELQPRSLTRVIGFAQFEIMSQNEYTSIAVEDGGLGLINPTKDTGQVRGRFVRYLIHPDEAASQLTTDGPIISPTGK